MLPLPIALHTAARRYLMMVHSRWTERYAEIGGGRSGAYTRQELDTFPRYNVANAMLEEVERLQPDEAWTLAEARERVVEAGACAQTVFTDPAGGVIQARAMAEERSAFESYVRTLTEADLAHIEPLPYRRVLRASEVERGWRDLHDAWGVKGYWYPLDESPRPDVIAFQAPYFDRDVGGTALRRILDSRGVGRVYELREYGANYELALALLDPEYNGAEGFWYAAPGGPGAREWLVYASHESSLTIGGSWLIEEVKALWPSWDRYLWTTPFF